MKKILVTFKNFYKSFFADDLFTKIITLSSKMALAQVMIIAASPILTRLYNPEDFGVLSIFVSAIGIGIVFSSLRFERVIPMLKSRRSLTVVLSISFIALTLSTIFLSISLIIFSDSIKLTLNNTELGEYLWIFPLGFFFAGFYEISTYVATRYQEFSLLGKTKIIQAIGQVSSQISIVSMGFLGSFGLIFGNIIGRSMGAYSLLILIKNDWSYRPKSKYLVHILAHIRRFWKFPIIQMPSALLSRLATLTPQLLFFTLYDPKVAGLIFLAQQMISAPLIFLRRSVSKVFFGHLSDIKRNKSIDTLSVIDSTVLRLFLIGLFPILILALFGPEIFNFVFGSKWLDSGIYARYLALFLLFQFAIAPILQTLIIYEKLLTLALIDTFRLLVTISSISFFYINEYSVDVVIFAYSLSMVLVYVLSYVLIKYTIKYKI